MLGLGMTVEFAGRRSQNMGGGRATRWYAPSAVLIEKSGLRLGAREAELPGIARNSPGGMILAQSAEAFANASFINPFDR